MIDIATPGGDMNNASTFARDDIGVAFDIATAIDHAMAGNATSWAGTIRCVNLSLASCVMSRC